jgi:hypothetical protein
MSEYGKIISLGRLIIKKCTTVPLQKVYRSAIFT